MRQFTEKDDLTSLAFAPEPRSPAQAGTSENLSVRTYGIGPTSDVHNSAQLLCSRHPKKRFDEGNFEATVFRTRKFWKRPWTGWKRQQVSCTLLVLALLAVSASSVSAENCTLTQGFWKNHEEVWPPLGSEEAMICGESWLENLKTSVAGDTLKIVSHQYIAARLNLAKGAISTTELDEALKVAEEVMADCIVTEEEHEEAILAAKVMDAFNQGKLEGGPLHCDGGPVLPPLPVFELYQSCGVSQILFSDDYAKRLDRLKLRGVMLEGAATSSSMRFWLRTPAGLIAEGSAECQMNRSNTNCRFTQKSAKQNGGVAKFNLKTKGNRTKLALEAYGYLSTAKAGGMCVSVLFENTNEAYKSCDVWTQSARGDLQAKFADWGE